MDKIYHIELDDYATPSIVSYSKSYYGTMNDIEKFIERFEEDEEFELIEAFREYQNGNQDAEITVAYNKRKMLEEAKVYGFKEIKSGGFEWEHINIWGFPYLMKCTSLDSVHYWIKDKEKFCRIIKANFKNLQYKNAIDKWVDIDTLWGFPHIIEFGTYNSLMVIEKEFNTIHELKNDMKKFNSVLDMNFTSFCNDIFGDG